MTTTEEWAQWEKQVINGVFPLHRAVSFSDHSAVFLTEHKALTVGDALLKLVPAIPTLRDTQLAYWQTAASLAHPNLIRLLEAGRCQLNGLQFLFVVMEYAEETLAQLLTRDGCTPGSLQIALRPILTSIGFLHQQQLVHGSLKPSNILIAQQQLKLATDTVRPIGEATASIAGTSVYDAPESRDGSISTAGDIWSLGVIIVEALTRHLPSWPDRDCARPVLPENLPAQYVDIVWQCLSRDPAKRPTVEELESRIDPEPKRAATAVHYPVLLPPAPEPAEASSIPPHGDSQDAPPAAARAPQAVSHRWLAPTLATVVILLAVGSVSVWGPLGQASSQDDLRAGWASAAISRDSSGALTSPVRSPADSDSLAPAVPAAVADSSTTDESENGDPDFGQAAEKTEALAVLHEEALDVPESALHTIHGHIKFAVRAAVDESGHVVHVSLASRSPSKYFTRIAMESARKWTFAPADDEAVQRRCLVWFDFTSQGAVSYADTASVRYAQHGISESTAHE